MSLSVLHEALVDLFRTCPELLASLDVLPAPPLAPARVVDAGAGQLAPPEFSADLALLFGEPPRLAVALEVQLGRDRDKRYMWPLYAATLARRWRCAGAVVVLTPDRGVARWADRSTAFGLACGAFRPHVLGPDAIPRITDAALARGEPGLAILSALAHGDGEDGLAVLLATLPVLSGLPADTARIYHDLVLGRLSVARQEELEAEMHVPEPYLPTSLFGQKHFGEGLSQGLQDGLKEGIKEGTHHLLMRLLVRRCGMLGTDTQARIAALELEKLEALGEASLDFTGVADLEAWLAANA